MSSSTVNKVFAGGAGIAAFAGSYALKLRKAERYAAATVAMAGTSYALGLTTETLIAGMAAAIVIFSRSVSYGYYYAYVNNGASAAEKDQLWKKATVFGDTVTGVTLIGALALSALIPNVDPTLSPNKYRVLTIL